MSDLRMMDPADLAKECLLIEKAGGSVREFLKNAGFISPWGKWWRLQKEQLGRKDNQITDGKGGADMNKITLEEKKRAVDIAIGGGNPLPFLKECGSKNPEGMWYTIRQNLKLKDPEKYAQIPERTGARKEEKAVLEAVKEAEKVEETAEVKGDALEVQVIALRDKDLGKFIWEEKPGVMYWRTDEGEEVVLKPVEWRKLADRLPKIMQVLGI